MNLGFAIDKCRILKGLTKSQLAQRSELSISYLSLIVSGQREPSLATIEKIASALGVPSSLLIFLASDESELSGLSKETQDELRRVATELIQASSEGHFS